MSAVINYIKGKLINKQWEQNRATHIPCSSCYSLLLVETLLLSCFVLQSSSCCTILSFHSYPFSYQTCCSSTSEETYFSMSVQFQSLSRHFWGLQSGWCRSGSHCSVLFMLSDFGHMFVSTSPHLGRSSQVKNTVRINPTMTPFSLLLTVSTHTLMVSLYFAHQYMKPM